MKHIASNKQMINANKIYLENLALRDHMEDKCRRKDNIKTDFKYEISDGVDNSSGFELGPVADSY
jgi:hypothetical protein